MARYHLALLVLLVLVPSASADKRDLADSDADLLFDEAEQQVCGRLIVSNLVNAIEAAGECSAIDDYVAPTPA